MSFFLDEKALAMRDRREPEPPADPGCEERLASEDEVTVLCGPSALLPACADASAVMAAARGEGLGSAAGKRGENWPERPDPRDTSAQGQAGAAAFGRGARSSISQDVQQTGKCCVRPHCF